MSHDFSLFPHSGIRQLSPYIPGKSIEALMHEKGLTDIIKLASNENPLGCSPLAKDALANLTISTIATYPSPQHHSLKKTLAQKLGIKETQLILSNGSDLLFTYLLILFGLHTGKSMLTHDKAFIGYKTQAETLGIPYTVVPIASDWSLDIDKFIEYSTADVGIIFLANPNNPTGTLTPFTEIERLLKNIPATTILVIDEAYYEYLADNGDNTVLPLQKIYPNLVVTRTFSKAYGLAGLRLGYGIADESIIQLLERIILPFSVNQAAMVAGEAALQDIHFLNKTRLSNQQGMHQLKEGLENKKIPFKLTSSNFILLYCPQGGRILYEKLLSQGIIVRPLDSYDLPDYLRITIGTSEQNNRLLDTLDYLL